MLGDAENGGASAAGVVSTPGNNVGNAAESTMAAHFPVQNLASGSRRLQSKKSRSEKALSEERLISMTADNVPMVVTPVFRSERNIFASKTSRTSSEISPGEQEGKPSDDRKKCCSLGRAVRTPGTKAYQGYLTFLTLGVIYGDIGTSPLYTMSTMFPVPPVGEDAVLGGLSLMLWSLIIVVAIKYVCFILLADDHGEGGTFALFALLTQGLRNKIKNPRTYEIVNYIVAVIALIGVSAVLADGILTPAITVMGAVQGLSVASPEVTSGVVVGVSCAILCLFFLPQRFGTSKISGIFSPIMLLWFIALAGIGIYNITLHPQVLQAFNPAYAVNFIGLDPTVHGYGGWQSLGAAFLTLTGSEALFADLGHFNARAIRVSALLFVLPCLMLCYCGQAAAIILDPTRVKNTFYLTIPSPLFYPMLVLAFCAAVIASQAMVSAAFSIIAQAIRLQYFPRMTVIHTDTIEYGQVYIPEINYFLMVMIIIVVVGFRDAVSLGYAYGVTVSLAFLLTSILYSVVIWANFNRHWLFGALFFLVFGFIDANFLAANLLKFVTGGWFSVIVTFVITCVLMVWRMGRSRLLETQSALNRPVNELFSTQTVQDDTGVVKQVFKVTDVDTELVICFSSSFDTIPASFVHFNRRFPIRPRHLVFITVVTVNVAFVESEPDMVQVEGHQHVYRLLVKHGYAERPPSAKKLATLIIRELQCYPDAVNFFPPPSEEELFRFVNPTFIVGRDRVALKEGSNFFHRIWVEMFQVLAFFSRSPVTALNVPPESTLEVGLQVAI
jgi:KUP system potassium uptake protein